MKSNKNPSPTPSRSFHFEFLSTLSAGEDQEISKLWLVLPPLITPPKPQTVGFFLLLLQTHRVPTFGCLGSSMLARWSRRRPRRRWIRWRSGCGPTTRSRSTPWASPPASPTWSSPSAPPSFSAPSKVPPLIPFLASGRFNIAKVSSFYDGGLLTVALAVGPVAAALLILGNVGVILGLFPAHVAWTIYSIMKWVTTFHWFHLLYAGNKKINFGYYWPF